MNAAACCPTRSLVSQEAWVAACSIAATAASGSLTASKCGDGHEADVAQDSVTSGEVGFLLENVGVLRGMGAVLNLTDLRALGLVADVLDLLPTDVWRGQVEAHRGVVQRERPLDADGQQ